MERESFGSRLKHAWNAFTAKETPHKYDYADIGPSFTARPDKPQLHMSSERTIISAIINRISIDVSRTTIQHVVLDKNGRFDHVVQSGLNNCLTLEANIDQSAQQFKHDITFSMLDEGYAAIVPIDTKIDIRKSDSIDILTLRVARIVEWHPQHVRVEAYNDKTGQKEILMFPKSKVAIVENPFYTVMNEPNSTLKRLVRKMALLDSIDEKQNSGKLDLLVQLPYAIKGELRVQQAELRRKALTEQLTDGFGVGYIDSTEHVTQLNRPIENSLPEQIDKLTDRLYNQLGMTKAILDGSASDQEWNNYYMQTIEPIVAQITGELTRKFLTKTARSQGHTIFYFKDPFRFIPVTNLANIADVMTRNAIMSSNEFRQILGMKAADNPDADALRNKNMPTSMEPGMGEEPPIEGGPTEEESVPFGPDTPVSMLGDHSGMMQSGMRALTTPLHELIELTNDLERNIQNDEALSHSGLHLPENVPRLKIPKDIPRSVCIKVTRNFKNVPGTGG